MRTDDQALTAGAYAKKQLFGGFSILTWSHRRRFETARALVARYKGRSLLDYGCGDGTFLAMVHGDFPTTVGLEVDPGLVAACTRQFGDLDGVRFLPAHAADTLPAASVGIVVCTEVLEHCLTDAVDAALARMQRLVAADGLVVISVPVETGFPLVVKQAARAIAGRLVSSDYRQRERYSVRDLIRMIVPGERTVIDRPVYETEFAPGIPNRYHGHKGFNWRAMRQRVARTFRVVETRFSPMSWLGPQFASQAWFICEPK